MYLQDLAKKTKKLKRRICRKKIKGFGLIEILVTLAAIGILSGGTVAVVNPQKKINQANDSKRQINLRQTQTQLEDYYNDQNCYPQSLPFGSQLKVGGNIYINKVPQDPNYPRNSYFYLTDGSACPAWYILFTYLKAYSASSPACHLSVNCLPAGYTKNWYCKYEGRISCDVIASKSLPIYDLASNLLSPTSMPIGKTSPTLSLTIIPSSTSPTTINSPTPISSSGIPPLTSNFSSLQGADDSYCYVSDGKTDSKYSNIGYATIGFCIDKKGIHDDYCETQTLSRDYYCTGIWNGSQWNNVNCSAGGYYCTNYLGNICSGGACTDSNAPPPTTATNPPPTKTLEGSDGTYCYDSDGNFDMLTQGSCQDNLGLYIDYCDGTDNVQDYYCTGKWNGSSYTGVRCAVGVHGCTSQIGYGPDYVYTCSSGKCIQTPR